MNFQPMPLTVGNAKLLQEWQDKLAAYIESTSKDRIMASISRLCAEDTEFAALVDKAIPAIASRCLRLVALVESSSLCPSRFV